MATILDDLKKIKKIDQSNVLGSIELLYAQIRQVLDEARLIKVPREYSKATNIVITGMGGSNLGGRIIQSVFSAEITVPITIVADYNLPASVNKNTLVIACSYSGNTEETLSAYQEARKKGAKIMAVTASSQGNKLEKLILANNNPGYIFKPQHNPSGQPRLGLGYAIFGIMVLLAKAGFMTINVKEIEKTITKLELWDHELRPSEPTADNQAKKMALEVFGRQLVLVGPEFLAGNLHALRNQFCENSKTFNSYLLLPDLNHYAMEGLSFPKINPKNLIFVFFDTLLAPKNIQRRSLLTKEVIKQNNIGITSHILSGKTKLEQSLQLLQLGSWISFYLGILNNVNPVAIPFVDWFKKQLGRKD